MLENVSIYEILLIHDEIVAKEINFNNFFEEENYIKKFLCKYTKSNENDLMSFFEKNWYCEEIKKYLSNETLKYLEYTKFHKKQMNIYIKFKNSISIKNQLDRNAMSNIRKYFLKSNTLDIVKHLKERILLLKEQLKTKDFYNFKKFGCSLSSKARKEEIKDIFNIEVTQDNCNMLDIKITIFEIKKFLNEYLTKPTTK